MSEYLKFKHLLEYFIAHLEYEAGKKKNTSLGYDLYIKPLLDNPSVSFKDSGQGYNDDEIQKQISGYDYFCNRNVCINVQPGYVLYNAATYINWKDAYTKIAAEWNEKKTHVVGLKVMFALTFKWNSNRNCFDADKWEIIRNNTLEELNLFDNTNTYNNEIISFLDYFNKSYLREKTNFWIINVKYDGTGTDIADIYLDGITMGFNRKDCPVFYEKIKPGDILIGVYNSHPNSICHCIGVAGSLDEKERTWKFNLTVKNKESLKKIQQMIRDNADDLPGKQSKNPWGIIKSIFKLEHTDIKDAARQIIEEEKNKMNIGNVKNILKAKKNIILQGAPGTGKTYNTASLALSIIGEDIAGLSHADIMKRYEELRKEGQIQFTTFHQSMDYEDFVEGIKPRVVEDDTSGMKMVSYETENGIFKRICNRAKEFDEDGNTNNNFESSWQKLVDKLEKENYFDVPYLSDESKTFRVEMNEYGTGLANRTYKDDIYEKGEWISGKSKFFSKEQLFNIHQGKKGTPAGGHDNYRRAIIAYMRDEKNGIGLEQKYNPPIVTSNGKPYVLIIDEINRGNVSKIFGELITLLEADKRELVGEDAKNQDLINGQHTITVTLPYSKEPFTVPSNLYIIGTMNTTDRSTGTLDYALRRRFAFATISSTPVYKKDDQGNSITEVIGCEELTGYYANKPNAPKDKANELFVKVYNFLSNPKHKVDMDIEDLMVGHSYFMANTLEELGSKLEYEIKTLIREYAKDGIISISEKELKDELAKWN